MVTTTGSIHVSEILGRALGPGAIPREAAAYLAGLELSAGDRMRLDQLADKARQGSLTDLEQQDLEEFRRVGRLVEVLKSSARRALAG